MGLSIVYQTGDNVFSNGKSKNIFVFSNRDQLIYSRHKLNILQTTAADSLLITLKKHGDRGDWHFEDLSTKDALILWMCGIINTTKRPE